MLALWHASTPGSRQGGMFDGGAWLSHTAVTSTGCGDVCVGWGRGGRRCLGALLGPGCMQALVVVEREEEEGELLLW